MADPANGSQEHDDSKNVDNVTEWLADLSFRRPARLSPSAPQPLPPVLIIDGEGRLFRIADPEDDGKVQVDGKEATQKRPQPNGIPPPRPSRPVTPPNQPTTNGNRKAAPEPASSVNGAGSESSQSGGEYLQTKVSNLLGSLVEVRKKLESYQNYQLRVQRKPN